MCNENYTGTQYEFYLSHTPPMTGETLLRQTEKHATLQNSPSNTSLSLSLPQGTSDTTIVECLFTDNSWTIYPILWNSYTKMR